MSQLLDFHFIYPFWLLALIPAVGLWFLLQKQQEATSQWQSLIAPNLLPYLIDTASEKVPVRPYRLLVAGLVLAALALAGPTWQREPSPFSEDEAPLVIVLDLSASMTVKDIQPSRLERGKQKIRDLLALRSTGRTALIAYAGSAHLVMPLTTDTRILETYLADLSPAVMPQPGNAPDLALTTAEQVLAKAPVPGSILFVTDGIGTEYTAAFADHDRHSPNDVVVLGVGTLEGGDIPEGDAAAINTYSRLDRQGLEALRRQAGAYVTEVTTDSSDLRQLNQHMQRHLAQVQNAESDRWRNEGHWLLYPLATLVLFWFRRGWTIQWLTGILLGLLLYPAPAWAFTPPPVLTTLPASFVNLWLTPDQQGRWLLERGNYGEAAERFEDPLWKGSAYYLNESFEAAAEQFARIEPKTAEVYFDLGNAYAQQGDYKASLKNYDRALAIRLDYPAAQANRGLVQARLEREEELAKQRTEEQEGDLKADQVVEDDSPPPDQDDQENKQPRPNQDGFGDGALADLWLQNVQTSPADFLKQKFQFQLDERSK
jgi:Ca-activated chloride channel family protein